MGIKRLKNSWKPVEIEDSLKERLDLDGLVGIEQCSDYELGDFLPTAKKSKVNQIKNSKKKKGKKAITQNGKEITDTNLTPSKSGSAAGHFHVQDKTIDLKYWNIAPLHPQILKGLKELGFLYPTEIQMQTLPSAILGKRDILGAAETGSGKTLAFGLPIINGILKLKERQVADEDIKPLFALILAPTRELAIQINNHLLAVAKFTSLKVAVVVGGLAVPKQERLLKASPEIVVATPGRLWELIQQGNSHLAQIDSLKFLAIDETDRMLERGHFQELEHILERINSHSENVQQRQNFVFSATLTLIHELPSHLAIKNKLQLKKRTVELTPAQKLRKIVENLGITNPSVIDITKNSKGTAEKLTECRITCAIHEKDFYVYYFLQRHPGRTLIFCNSIGCVKRLTTLLSLLRCGPLALHASMQQRQRLKNLDRFRDRDNCVLVATDVAARGLDIPNIKHVLHYQTPRTTESYVHRSGRTARASAEGITVLLVEAKELQNYLRLCRTLGKTEDIPHFPVQEHYLNAVKQRVNLAREVDKLDLQVRRSNAETGWYEKAAEEMDIVVDNPSLKYDAAKARACKKMAVVRKKQLAALLAKPIFPKSFNIANYPPSSSLNDDFLSIAHNLPTQSAIEVMKSSLEKPQTSRKRPRSLFKSKIKHAESNVSNKELLAPNKQRRM